MPFNLTSNEINSTEVTKSSKNGNSESTIDKCPTTFYIDICCIGNADSFLLWKKEDFMLVDTGKYEDAEGIVGLLIKREVSALKALVITHYDNDHTGAYLAVINHMISIKSARNPQTIEHIYSRKYTRVQLDILPVDRYRNYIKIMNGILRYQGRGEEEFMLDPLPDTGVVEEKANELFGCGDGLWIFPGKMNLCGNFTLDGDVQILWLNRLTSYLKAGTTQKALAGNVNNDSLIFKAIYCDKSALFLGDMGQSGLNDLIQYNSFCLKSDILKIAHHGHKHSSPKNFINEVKPTISFVTTTLDSIPDHDTFCNRLEELTAGDIDFGSLIYSGEEKGAYSTIAIRETERKIFTLNTSIIGYRF
jgi:beta-lactamase superfamily II metal-dependent hydrolase